MTETETVAEATQEKTLSLEQQFINRLHLLKENDKGAMAKLKRNAGNTLAESRGVHAIFFRLLPHGVPEWKESYYFLVATLYPLASPATKGSLGTALKTAKKNNPKNKDGYDRRMEVLLDCDADQLSFRLRQVVRLLKSAEVPVNWQGLLKDLTSWNYINRFVQEKWARDYYTD
jgi:CRISPR system Cascade subunit CasB